jgi:thioredoxin reductase
VAPALTVVLAAPKVAEPKPTDNQAPGGNLRPRIDLDLCVGCGTCVHVCPFNVLEIVNEKAIAARLGDCTGFAACAAECPTEAIVLVAGGAMQTVELPIYDANLETNVPGLYLAGEVTGKALIKVAINQGKQVLESILKNRPQPGAQYDVIVVGAGPAGTSTALAALSEGLKVLVLEQGTQANTIRNYPRQKFVMAEPVMIPVYGPLWMEDSSKESLLERWQQIIASTGLAVQEEEKVLRVVQNAGHFVVHSTKGEYQGARVVMAIGKRGSPRKLGAPGEDSSKVAYNLLDADAYRGKAICIVGGGDSGIEAACGLARPDLENRVWLVHRTDAFSQAKPRNQKKIKKSMDEGRVTAFFNSALVEIRERSAVIKTATGDQEIDNDFVFVMVGGESPKKFLNECGIEFSQRPLG